MQALYRQMKATLFRLIMHSFVYSFVRSLIRADLLDILRHKTRIIWIGIKYHIAEITLSMSSSFCHVCSILQWDPEISLDGLQRMLKNRLLVSAYWQLLKRIYSARGYNILRFKNR